MLALLSCNWVYINLQESNIIYQLWHNTKIYNSENSQFCMCTTNQVVQRLSDVNKTVLLLKELHNLSIPINKILTEIPRWTN